MIKVVLISLVISLIVLTSLYFIGDKVMQIKMEKETSLDSTWNGIMGANIEEQGTTYNYSLTSATAKTKLVKKSLEFQFRGVNGKRSLLVWGHLD